MDVGEVLRNASAALSELDVSLGCLAEDDAVDLLVGVHRIRAQAEGIWCRLAHEGFNLTVMDDPASTVAGVASDKAGTKPRVARYDARLGSWLASFPAFSEASRCGDLSKDHLKALKRLDNTRTHLALVEAQDYLIEAAKSCSHSQFLQVLAYWEARFDPDGRKPADQVESRHLSVKQHYDGTVTGRFKLDPISGAAVKSAIELQSQRLFRAESDGDEPRSLGQRQADAFTRLVVRGSTAEGEPNPLVHIVMSQKVAEDTIQRMTGESDSAAPLPLDPDDIDRRCELINGIPLHPRLSIGALSTGVLSRLVFGADNSILNLGRTVRSFPRHLRQALLVQGRGRCRAPGCDAPLAWLESDHIKAWSRGGPTDISNGQVLCGPHNKAKRDHDPPQAA